MHTLFSRVSCFHIADFKWETALFRAPPRLENARETLIRMGMPFAGRMPKNGVP